MQLKLTFKFKDLILPINYNHTLHGVVTKWLGDTNYRNFIHNQGYNYEKRSFKLYTFSDLLGKYQNLGDGRIKYINNAGLYIASYDEDFLKFLIKNVIFEEKFTILNSKIFIEKIETINTRIEENHVFIKTLSPVTIYSTFTTVDGKKKTHYYHPNDNEFSELIRKNLVKKYFSYHNTYPKNSSIQIKLVSKPELKIKRYKGFIIKGWIGLFKLEGPQELIKVALDTGIGSKNSQGFGFVKEVKNAGSNL